MAPEFLQSGQVRKRQKRAIIQQAGDVSVFKYIETFYNPDRMHQALGYLTPDQYEAVHAAATEVVMVPVTGGQS